MKKRSKYSLSAIEKPTTPGFKKPDSKPVVVGYRPEHTAWPLWPHLRTKQRLENMKAQVVNRRLDSGEVIEVLKYPEIVAALETRYNTQLAKAIEYGYTAYDPKQHLIPEVENAEHGKGSNPNTTSTSGE